MMIRRKATMGYIPISEIIWILDGEKYLNDIKNDFKIDLKKL